MTALGWGLSYCTLVAFHRYQTLLSESLTFQLFCY